MASVKGGDLFDKILTDMAKKLDKGGTVRVGFLEGSTYPDGTSTPLVAIIQEFGAPARKIPPRPFMRNTFAEHSGEWPDIIAKILVANSYDTHKTLALMGEVIAGQIRDSIIGFTSPPNSPATIARKGFATPLRDSGHMLNSVQVEVKD